MSTAHFANRDEVRADFSRAISQMYKNEVPLYGNLMDLVADTNQRVMSRDSRVAESLCQTGEIQRLNMERHGAIRVGTAWVTTT